MTAVTLNPTSLPTPPVAASAAGTAAGVGALDTSPSGSAPTGSSTSSTQAPPSKDVKMPGKDDFLKLLIAELRHQNPLQPMDSQSYITQLAQFNAVEQMQKMNSNIEAFTTTQSIMEAASLLGKTVGYRLSSNSSDPLLSGHVSSVSWATGTPKLSVDNKEVDLKQIVSVE